MVSHSSNSSRSSGCPEEYSWAASRRIPYPGEEIILNDLDNAVMDDPPLCPHAATKQDIARRHRDRVEALEVDLAHQRHNSNNVDAVNEGLYERISDLSVYNCKVVNDLAATRALAAENAAAAQKYKVGFWIATWMLVFAVMHILFQ